MPLTIRDYLSVQGAESEVKWEKYGKGFLEIIKKHSRMMKRPDTTSVHFNQSYSAPQMAPKQNGKKGIRSLRVL
jgi:hypothetical protein